MKIRTSRMDNGDEGARWSIAEVARRSSKARLDPHVRAWVVQTLKAAKDAGRPVSKPLERANEILMAVRRDFVYVPDPAHSEYLVDPHLLIKGVIPGGDCFPATTLVLTRMGTMIEIQRLKPGTEIWGLDGWTRVRAVHSKGDLPMTRLALSNGAILRLTAGHHVPVAVCVQHESCNCGYDRRVRLTLEAGQLIPGSVLLYPEQLTLERERLTLDGLGDLSQSSHPGFHEALSRTKLRCLGLASRKIRHPEGDDHYLPDASPSPLVEVLVVQRDIEFDRAYDIETESGYVYLPECDVVVKNCDDLTNLTAACLMAALANAGIRGAVLGQSYSKSKRIQHVLCAIYVDKKWYYTDASTDKPFGETPHIPTWEITFDVPTNSENPKPFCDASACLIGSTAVAPPALYRDGDFVGVSGPPVEYIDPVEDGETVINQVCTTCWSPFSTPVWSPFVGEVTTEKLTPDQVREALEPGVIAELERALSSITNNLQDLNLAVESLRQFCQDNGYSFPPTGIAQFQPSDLELVGKLNMMASSFIDMLKGALNGDRKIFYDAKNELSIEGLAADAVRWIPGAEMSREIWKSIPVSVPSGMPGGLTQSNDSEFMPPGVGIPHVALVGLGAAGLVVGVTVLLISHGDMLLLTMREVIRAAENILRDRAAVKMLEAGATAEEVGKIQQGHSKGQTDRMKEETEWMKQEVEKIKAERDKYSGYFDKALLLGGLVLLGGVGVWAYKEIGPGGASRDRLDRELDRRYPGREK